MSLIHILKGEQPGLIKTIQNYENVGQFGEYATEFALTNNNLEGILVVLKNLYIPYKNTTSEIDLVMVHEKGIYVFESKNYSGWIFGSADQLYWTQSLKGGEKNKFYNPIRQNRTHITALASYLGKPETEFKSYIVFSERCELKNVPNSTPEYTIVRRPNMLKALRRELACSPILYTADEVHQIADKLVKPSIASSEEKKQHIEDIQTKCPFCGGNLVERSGKWGKFYGCSNYPKCKFTKPIKP